ncbi:hypothetical protein BDA96_02G446400 [Sorghum bicolor]|uniref:Uncharacterized protein n=1 Tax=Sorghum bicolor TaxID=4558 RepID=A0A921RW87_SORBI|nr:hypothetical protein BDA96_02G446400 [Sorghum bicolor]
MAGRGRLPCSLQRSTQSGPTASAGSSWRAHWRSHGSRGEWRGKQGEREKERDCIGTLVFFPFSLVVVSISRMSIILGHRVYTLPIYSKK